MKYIDEYRDPQLARNILDEIRRKTTRHWTIMEICGGQTHSIIRNGIDQLLPDTIELVHGPGCPVCVTPLESIERALAHCCPKRGDIHQFRRYAACAGQFKRSLHGSQ